MLQSQPDNCPRTCLRVGRRTNMPGCFDMRQLQKRNPVFTRLGIILLLSLIVFSGGTRAQQTGLIPPEDANPALGAFQSEALNAHNRYREMHGTKPLVWDNELERVAQLWSDKQAREDKMYHSRGKYGENLYWRSNQNVTGATAVDSWYAEISLYDFKNPDMKKRWGHFSQVLWTDSVRLGCARAVSRKGGTYVTCNYDPPGNYNGQYKQKVRPPKSAPP